MENKLAPIALFVYNRPEHTKKTIEALKKNELADKSELFIFSDGPKTEKERENVNKVRDFIKNIKGFKKINIIEQEKNLGLAESIILGITKVVNKYGRVIVLEDDIVTSKHFLKYMNDALEVYEDEKIVGNICGYVYPVRQELPETFFLKFFSCWGWATWKDRWRFFEKDGKRLLLEIKKRGLKKEFDVGGTYPYTKMLKHQIKGKNNSWAVRWYASSSLKDFLCLYPKNSLVQNMGFEGIGTHGSKLDWFDTSLSQFQIKIKKIPLYENKFVFRLFKDYLNRLRSKRILNKLKQFFKFFK